MYSTSNKPAYWDDMQLSLTPKGAIQITIESPDIGEVVFDNFTETEDDFLLSFSHHRSGDLLTNALPRNIVEFTVCNISGRWDPDNPNGYGKWLVRYAKNKLVVTVKYGYLPGELIYGGRFYLSECTASSDGLEVHFKAVDPLEYMIGKKYSGKTSLYANRLLAFVIAEAEIPREELELRRPGILGWSGWTEDYTTTDLPTDLTFSVDETLANIYQKIANARRQIINFDRLTGDVFMEGLREDHCDYTIPLAVSYSYPLLEKQPTVSRVEVQTSEGKVVCISDTGGKEGEVISVSNDLITPTSAMSLAEYTTYIVSCTKISGEYRSDLYPDLYDKVAVETRYGTVENVVLTDIAITFTGSFRAKYEGYVFVGGESSKNFLGENYLGEVSQIGITI